MSQTIEYPPAVWNATEHPYRTDIVPARLIVEVAQRAPQAPALLTADGVAYTYGELLAEANRLAHLLDELGVGPGDYVGVVGRHRPETVVAQVAIALAGAAFVPCRPDWPPNRLGHVIESTGARCLVGGADDLALLDGYPPVAPTLTDIVLLDVPMEEPPLAPPAPVGWPRQVDETDAGRIARLVLAGEPSSVLEIGHHRRGQQRRDHAWPCRMRRTGSGVPLRRLRSRGYPRDTSSKGTPSYHVVRGMCRCP
jgi:hypothetical protein